jgi:hypothetical protein
MLRYFAYGSNMSLPRLRQRVPGARAVARATLGGHTLRWHKRGRDGSGKCDAFAVNDEQAFLNGVLFEIPAVQKAALDTVEGLGSGYEEKAIELQLAGGERADALTYYATDIQPELRPFCWYKYHVLAGARQFSLPQEYQGTIESVVARDDVNRRRREMELEIYGESALLQEAAHRFHKDRLVT